MTINCPTCGHHFQVQALTPKEQKLFDFISLYRKAHNVTPSLREMTTHMNLKSHSTIWIMVKRMEEKGALLRTVKGARGTVPVDELKAA